MKQKAAEALSKLLCGWHRVYSFCSRIEFSFFPTEELYNIFNEQANKIFSCTDVFAASLALLKSVEPEILFYLSNMLDGMGPWTLPPSTIM